MISSSVRRDELVELVKAWETIGRQSRVLDLAGAPGSGKSHLLTAFSDEAERCGSTVLRGDADGETAFGPFLDALGVEPEPDMPDSRARALLEGRSAGGAVLLLDDFHRADPSSVAFLDYLVRWPLGTPLVIVVAQRPRQSSARLRGSFAHGVELGSVRRLVLAPLTAAQSAEVLGLPASPATPPGAAYLRLHQQSQGYPGYLLALASSSHGHGELERHTACLREELASAEPAETLALTCAAVLGDGFRLAEIRESTGLGWDRTVEVLTALVERDILRTAQQTLTYAFRHPVVRQVAYDAAPPALRSSAELAALTVLARRGAPVAELALHLEHRTRPQQAVDLPTLIRAADETVYSDPSTAAKWISIVLDAMPADTQLGKRVELQIKLAQAHGVTGKLSASRDLLYEVLGTIPREQRDLRVSALSFYALMESMLGRYADATETVGSEAELAHDEGVAEWSALNTVMGVIELLSSRGKIDRSALDRSILAARTRRDYTAESGALALRGLHETMVADDRLGKQTLAAAAALLDGLPDATVVRCPEYLAILGWAEALAGLFTDAERHLRRGSELAIKAGRSYLLPVTFTGLSLTWLISGSLAEADSMAAEAAELAQEIGAGHLYGLALSLQALTRTSLSTGPNDKAIALGEAAVAALPPDECGWHLIATLALASATLIHGDPTRCIDLLEDHARDPDILRASPTFRSKTLELLATAFAALGDAPAAARWAEAAEADTRVDGASVRHGHALMARAHALSAQHDYALSAALYRAAAERFAAARMTHAQSRSLLLAAICLDKGSSDEADTVLGLAKELALRCGANRLLDGIETRQRNLATRRPGRGATVVLHSLFSGLTDREREVARIAGTGKKTREIADELRLSPRTIDIHLTHIYRKLNISSRAALANLLSTAKVSELL